MSPDPDNRTPAQSDGGGGSSGGNSGREGGRPRDERGGRGGRRRGGRRRGGQGRRAAKRPSGERVARDAAPPASLVAYLARSGVGSRRLCDEMVRAGRVTVNGEAVDFPRHKLEPDDVVAVDGDAIECRPLRYVLVNKARGVASTRSDPHADKVIVDVVPDGRVLFPVGRLDVQTTGLIVLTNDGPLAHRLMHPSYGVPKTYVARVRGRVGRRQLAALRNGVELEDGPTAPADARLLKQSARTALVELTIHQGRKRQVRRMFAALDLTVDELHRRRYGPLVDADLAVGDWRELTDDEVEALRRAAEHVDSCVGEEPVEHGVNLAATAVDEIESEPTLAPAEEGGGLPAAAPPDQAAEAATGLVAEAPADEAAESPPEEAGEAAEAPADDTVRDGQTPPPDEPVDDSRDTTGGAIDDDTEAPTPL